MSGIVSDIVPVRNTLQVCDATIVYKVDNINELEKKKFLFSPKCSISNTIWYLKLVVDEETKMNDQQLGIFILSERDLIISPELWSCSATVELTVVNQKAPHKSVSYSIMRNFNALHPGWGFAKFIKWSEVIDTAKGYLEGDTLTVRARFQNLSPIMHIKIPRS